MKRNSGTEMGQWDQWGCEVLNKTRPNDLKNWLKV